MKASIHPQWFSDAQIMCACGNVLTVGSTKELIKMEVCSRCHPFFTGESRFVDKVGKVERFEKMRAKAASNPVVKKAKKDLANKDNQPKSLREMLLDLQKK